MRPWSCLVSELCPLGKSAGKPSNLVSATSPLALSVFVQILSVVLRSWAPFFGRRDVQARPGGQDWKVPGRSQFDSEPATIEKLLIQRSYSLAHELLKLLECRLCWGGRGSGFDLRVSPRSSGNSWAIVGEMGLFLVARALLWHCLWSSGGANLDVSACSRWRKIFPYPLEPWKPSYDISMPRRCRPNLQKRHASCQKDRLGKSGEYNTCVF